MAQGSRDGRSGEGVPEEAEDVGGGHAFEILPCDVQLLGKIGEGTTAAVYLARIHGEQYAVKEVLPAERGDGLDSETLQAVQRELGVLSAVQHPNILKFFGIVQETNRLRWVLEYCSGGSLFELLHNRWHLPISWPKRFKMLQDTAAAQTYLHSCDPPILHRDLKSLNLMLKEAIRDENDDPIIKLADFGFARAEGRSMTQCVGTRHWMAPEVTSSTVYGKKADVFSFAMVTYEVCCRHVAFEELDPGMVSERLAKGFRPDLYDSSIVPPEASPRLLELISRCWAQKPAERPTFDEIYAEITELADESTKAPCATEPLAESQGPR